MIDTQTLFQALDKHLSLLKDCLSCLQAEKALIEDNQLDTLQSNLQRKEDVVEQLKSQHQALLQLSGHQNLEGLYPHIPGQEQPQFSQKLDAIKQLNRQCDELSQVNAMLIMASKNMAEHMIDFITGRKKNQTYSKYAKAEATIESTQHTRI